MQKQILFTFLDLLTNTNKCCQMFLTFLKRSQQCFLFKKYSLLDSCQQPLVVVPALFERSPRVKLQTLKVKPHFEVSKVWQVIIRSGVPVFFQKE